MKKLLLVFLCISCSAVSAQRKPKIKGNKSIITVSEDLPAFHSIELIDNLEILLQESDNPGYSITADDNLIDVLKFEVKDSTLYIRSFYIITSKKQLDITVRCDELRSLVLKDGKVFSESVISTDRMAISTSGFSNADLRFSTSVTALAMAGNSKAVLNIDSDSLAMSLAEKTEADIYAVSTIQDIDVKDDAIATIEGTTDTLEVKLRGRSKLRAEKLEASTTNLEILDGAAARIYAYRRLQLDSSGSSKVYLYGDPEIEMLRFEDNSTLYKRTE